MVTFPQHGHASALKVYAKCIDGQDQIAKRHIEDALRETGTARRTPAAAVEDVFREQGDCPA